MGTNAKRAAPLGAALLQATKIDGDLGLGYFSCNWHYRYKRAFVAAFLKLYGAINQRKQRVVFAHAHVGTSVVLGAALTHDDVASDEGLTTEDFHA
jgi:hypothetical protein